MSSVAAVGAPPVAEAIDHDRAAPTATQVTAVIDDFHPAPPFMDAVAPDPPARPRRRSVPALAVIAVVVTMAAAAIGAFALTRSAPYPVHWDPRVADIAAQVESLRGLTFKHPVKVNYLSVASFEKRLTASPEDVQRQRTQIDRATGLLRAAGLLGGDVDLADAANTSRAANTLAYYDTKAKQIYIRGTGAFTIDTRVTLAHELTHVLQDQHFDLQKLQKRATESTSGSSDALTALIEGDAMRTENQYLEDQSKAEQREYARLSARNSAQAGARTKHVPAVVETAFGAPYIFGPSVIQVLDATQGTTAINDALTGPTPSTRIYLDPTAINEQPADPPAVPVLHANEKKITLSSNDDEFDDFSLYLMLAARLDGPTALRAADAYKAGSESLYTTGGHTCFRAAIVGQNRRATSYLATTLRRWIAIMPDAHIDSDRDTIVFDSCDPGGRADTPDDARIREAIALAVGRDSITATIAAQGASRDLAACAARLIVEQPEFRDAIIHNDATAMAKPSPGMLRASADAGIACRQNSDAGLP